MIPGLGGFGTSLRHTTEILCFFGGALLLQVVFARTLHLSNIWLRVSLAVGVIVLASPVLARILRKYGENDFPRGQFNFHTQSWMFLADTWALAPAAGIIAFAWRHQAVRDSWLVAQWWWLPLCMALAFAAGFGFHIMDAPNYAHIPGAITSLTKRLHDFLTYPVLFSSLLYGSVPMLRLERVTVVWTSLQVKVPRFLPEVKWEAGLVLGLVVGGWLIIGGILHDMRAGVLNPVHLHGPRPQ